jgi:hypothetical protein
MPRKTAFHRITPIVALLLWAGADAAMYKWIDETGQTVYSQTPPPSGDATQIEKAPAPDAAEAERRRQRLSEELERSYDQEMEEDQLRSEQEKTEGQRQARSKNCEAARKNLQTLESLGRRMVRTPEGNYLRLSEQERKAKIDKARADIEKFCN